MDHMALQGEDVGGGEMCPLPCRFFNGAQRPVKSPFLAQIDIWWNRYYANKTGAFGGGGGGGGGEAGAFVLEEKFHPSHTPSPRLLFCAQKGSLAVQNLYNARLQKGMLNTPLPPRSTP